MAVDRHADHVLTGFDVERVPVEILLEAGLGLGEQINAAGTVIVAVIGDLNFVSDMGGSALGIEAGALRILRARGIADGDATIAAPAQPELEVQIVGAELLFCVEPALVLSGFGDIALPEQSSIAQDIPESLAYHFPSVEIFSIQQLYP